MNQGDPILRVVPAPRDINANGHIFGGWVLAQMDIAGGILASNVAAGPVATVAIDAMEFIEPILLNDVISVYAHVERRGRTSLGIRIDSMTSYRFTRMSSGAAGHRSASASKSTPRVSAARSRSR